MRESSLSTVISISVLLCNYLASLSHFQLYNYPALIQVAHLFDANTVKIVYYPLPRPLPTCFHRLLSHSIGKQIDWLCVLQFILQLSLLSFFLFFWFFIQLLVFQIAEPPSAI